MSAVKRYDLPGVLQLVGDTLALRLARAPKLQVFNAIIASVSVEMMDLLFSKKRATEMRLHDESVLPLPLVLAGDVSLAVDVPLRVCNPFAPLARIGPTDGLASTETVSRARIVSRAHPLSPGGFGAFANIASHGVKPGTEEDRG